MSNNVLILGQSTGMMEPGRDASFSKFKRPEHLSLVDIAYNVLLEAILSQEFEPGAQIGIDSLAKQLNMSNTPVREALMRAKGERLVQQKTNHGFVVARVLTPQELHQLFDVRHILETHAVNAAVLTAEAIEKLTNLVSQMLDASDGSVYQDYKDFLLLDHQFHRVLVSLANNDFLLKAWEDLHVHLHLSRLYSGVGLHDRAHAVREHQGILEAVQQRDKHEVAVRLGQHIERVEQSLQSLLER